MRRARQLSFVFVICALSHSASGADSFEELLARASLDYETRLVAATEELNAARERIATERLPLVTEKQNLEDKVLDLELDIVRLKTAKVEAADERDQLLADLGSINENLRYISALAQDSLRNLDDLLLPGETQFYGPKIAAAQQALSGDPEDSAIEPLFSATDLIVDRLEAAIGGYELPGTSVRSDDSNIVEGSFAILGPEVFFRAHETDLYGAVRTREGAAIPVTYVLSDWNRSNMEALFEGGDGTVFADVSGGKALRLREFEGSLGDHIQRGGIVGYVIIALGAFALLAGLLKVIDMRALAVDDPEKIEEMLQPLSGGVRDEAGKAIEKLKATSRELFSTGMRHLDKPKALLEEHLFAFVLRQRIRHERRLPLLTVIAAAAPLLGLLGTVVGMVKTFTLITVFGTGNAEKLSSGISEALVTTELGLIVAIPTLIIHGFLSYRAQKGLARLEQYSVEFIAAAEQGKLTANPA